MLLQKPPIEPEDWAREAQVPTPALSRQQLLHSTIADFFILVSTTQLRSSFSQPLTSRVSGPVVVVDFCHSASIT